MLSDFCCSITCLKWLRLLNEPLNHTLFLLYGSIIVVFFFDALIGLTWHMLTPCWLQNMSPIASMIMHSGSQWYVYTYNDKSLLETLSRVAWGLGIHTSRDVRFSTYDLSSICFIIVLAFTLTIQDAYDGGNESSKLVSTIIFEGL
jgi:hypothetical protein